MMTGTTGRPRLRLLKTVIFFIALLIVGNMSLTFAQDINVDINKLTQEAQKMSQSSDEMTMVWWIPKEFWAASFSQDPNMTEAQTEKILKVFHPYILIAAVDGKI